MLNEIKQIVETVFGEYVPKEQLEVGAKLITKVMELKFKGVKSTTKPKAKSNAKSKGVQVTYIREYISKAGKHKIGDVVELKLENLCNMLSHKKSEGEFKELLARVQKGDVVKKGDSQYYKKGATK